MKGSKQNFFSFFFTLNFTETGKLSTFEFLIEREVLVEACGFWVGRSRRLSGFVRTALRWIHWHRNMIFLS